ncbi:MAG: arylsulfatase [Verrucomicrobiales bacterium]|nr:arylsulfatase [Verrucomicrobiales bacterium]
MKLLHSFLSLALVCGSLSAADRPNIIYILADDLGVGDVGCYGQRLLKTPRIDQLAEEGMRFTQHYSGSASCAPTRSCLMTGQHTGHTRVRKNGDGPLLPGDVTIGEVLQEVGYKTAAIGKWGVGEIETTGVPWNQGFDYFFGYLNQRNAHSHYPPFMWRNDEKVLYPGNAEMRTHYSHDEFTREALSFIHENQDEPFFLYVPYTLVHVDLDVPADSMEPWIGNIEETSPHGSPGGQHYIYQETPHAAFAGMVSRLDRDVGRIVDLVDELGMAENTLIIFSSDNGPTPAGGADPEFFDGNGPFRGIKFEFYEGGIRCPMIARWPGKVAAGSETDHVSAQWDLLPTAAELTGASVPEAVDGVSFLPTLLGNDAQQAVHDHLYWEAADKKGWQAVRRGNWKGHRIGTRTKGDAVFELYDLSKDIAEESNVADANPGVVKELSTLMDAGRTAPATDTLFQPK